MATHFLSQLSRKVCSGRGGGGGDMVVGMLTSPKKRNPSRSVEEDGRNPTTAHHPVHRSDLHVVRHPAVHHTASPAFPCSDDPGSSSASGSSRTARMNPSDRAEFLNQQRATSSERNSTESHEGGDESRHRPSEDKTTTSCKRKFALTPLSSGSRDATKAQDYEDKDPESPPPAKRWVIGPIFQSFKSKMASFAEIVMSPVRLFKPSEFPPTLNPEAHEDREEIETDGKIDTFSKEKKKLTPLTKLQVIQRLRFDTDSSDSEHSRVTGSQNRSESREDSIPVDDASFGSQKATNENTDDVSSLKQSRDSASVTTRSGSGTKRQKLIVLCEQMTTDKLKMHTHEQQQIQDQGPTLAKKSRFPTPAVGKRRGAERRELLVMVKRAETECAIGTRGAEESSMLTTLENPPPVRTGIRRRVRVSGESLSSTYTTGDVQVYGSSERQKKGPSRSRSRKEKGVKSSSKELTIPNVTSDSTPHEGPPGSVAWTSSRTTRQQKNREHEKSAHLADLLSSSSRTSGSERVRRDNVRQTRHTSKTSKSPHNTDLFEGQGMSMSLTLKVGSGVDQGLETSCKRTLKRRNAGKEQDVRTDAPSPSRTTPEDVFGADDDQLVDDVRLEKKKLCVCLNRELKRDEGEQKDVYLASIRCGTNPLKRSLSCPDISLQHGSHGIPSSDDFIDDRPLCYPPSPLKRAPHLNANAPSPVKRTRRHTVCSVEIEREIAPLCLRKEVYPAWGSTSSHPHPHSPSKSLASLISRFLSSPLAFRSKKSAPGGSDLGVASPSSPPSQNLLRTPAFPSSADESAFFSDAPRTPWQTPVSSQCSAFDSVSMEAEEAVITQHIEEKRRSSEEKALSDSEIKSENKQVEHRKVSSIRIRKTLPKPQYNLTPMGLPKAVRIKKKVFSVEEIYTNKNFSKPPEGRLETIFEVPLSRRDGSQSLMGPKRMKRVVDFPELGVARKLRRPLVGGAGGGAAQRKAAGNSGTGRTRRGREEEAVHVQDFDSLLCSKLDELDLWMATEDLVY